MKNWPGAQKTFCWFLWTMVVFDLNFLADWVRIFSLKDETVNFLLGKTQVDYFLSQRSLLLVKLKTWRMVSSINFLCRHLPQKTTIQRRDQKRWFSREVHRTKTLRQDARVQILTVPLTGGTALGIHLPSLCLCVLTDMAERILIKLPAWQRGHDTEMRCARWRAIKSAP